MISTNTVNVHDIIAIINILTHISAPSRYEEIKARKIKKPFSANSFPAMSERP